MKTFHQQLLMRVLLVLLAFSSIVFAQKGTSIVKRIKFLPGRTTVVEKGSVRRGISNDYLLKARAGQNMTLHLATSAGVCFDLFSPGMSDQLANCSKDWTGELPKTGDYRINVLPDTTTERNISFTLEASVRN